MIWRFTLSNSTAGSLALSDEPIGWEDISLEMKRDMSWHGIFFEYSVNLKFYATGYDYIKSVYNSQGIGAYIELLVESKCSDSDSYSEFYSGKLMVGKARFDCSDDCIVEVPLEPPGCLMKFRNRIDQKVDLIKNEDFSGKGLVPYTYLPFEMDLPSKTIVLRSLADEEDQIGQYDYVGPTDTIHYGSGTQVFSDSAYWQIPIKNIAVNELSVNEEDNAVFSTIADAPVNFTAPFTANYTFDIDLFYLYGSAIVLTAAGMAFCTGFPTSSFSDYSLDVGIYVNDVLVYSELLDSVSGACFSGYKVFSISNHHLNTTETILAGDTVKILVGIHVYGEYHKDLASNNDINLKVNDPNSLSPATFTPRINVGSSIKAKLISNPSPCQVFAINETLSRVVECITDDCMRVKSDYFGRTDSQPYTSDEDGCGSLEVITKGLLIRQFPLDQVIMPISFQDLWQGLNPIHNIGIGIEPDADRTGYDRLRVEPMEYFYDSATILMTCDNVPDIKKQVKAEWYPSVIQFGYEKWEAENSMGLDEFNTKREYRTTLPEIKNTSSNVSKFIASGYSIEVTRNIEFVDQSAKDWRYDNDTFIICCRRSGRSISVEQGAHCTTTSLVENILDPDTIYNYRISPIRNFLRWIKAYSATYFNSLAGADSKLIFTNADGNFIAKGKLINGCVNEAAIIAENDTIDVATLADSSQATPIFKYELDTFEYPMSLSESLAVRNNPRGVIKYRKSSSDAWSLGYIYNVQYKPNQGMATFTLLPKYDV